MEQKSVTPSRHNNVSVLRFLAAFMVMAGHMCFIAGMNPTVFFDTPVQSLGIKIFFILGGYFVANSWASDPNPLRYAIKRFFRIWPPLAAFVVIAACVAGPVLSTLPVQEYFRHPFFGIYFKNLALNIQYALPGVFENNPYPVAVNGSLWSLPVEATMYLVIPLLFSLVRYRKSQPKRFQIAIIWGICLALCAFHVVLKAFYPTARVVFYAVDWVSAMDNIPFYFIGIACSVIDIKKYLNLPLAIFLIIAASCFVRETISQSILLLILLPYLVLSFSFAPPLRVSAFFDRHEVSYGLYLYGFFIQQVVMLVVLRLGIPYSQPGLLIVSFLLTLAVALLSRSCIEQPCLKLSKQLLKRVSV